MLRIRCAIVLAALAATTVLTGTLASARPQNKKDQIPGARYSYKAVEVGDKDLDGKEIDSGVFRAEDGKLFKKDSQIGTYKHTTKNEVHLNITKGKLEGKIDLDHVKGSNPSVWRGTWKSVDGGRYRMTLTLVKD